MGLRPQSARWFEVLTTQEGVATLVEALAATGAVEIETRVEGRQDAAFHPPHQLSEIDRIGRRYAAHWPRHRERSGTQALPAVVLDTAVTRLREFAVRADPIIERLDALEHEWEELLSLVRLMEAGGAELPDLRALSKHGPLTEVCVVRVAAQDELPDLPPRVLRHVVHDGEAAFVVLVGPRAEMESAREAFEAAHASSLSLPPWLGEGNAPAKERIDVRLSSVEREIDAARRAIAALSDELGLSEVLDDVDRLRWYASHIPELERTRHFVVISGWTDDFGGSRLRAAIERCGVPALLQFPAQAGRDRPPVVLKNPPWVQPFETFLRLLGMPSPEEADPTTVLGLMVPVLFGFMFGDVGQGAALLVAGLVLGRRYPMMRLLVPGGLSSVFFGFLFGSFFALEGVVPALWMHPLEAPLHVLSASLLLGAGILLTGLFLHAAAEVWSGRGAAWMVEGLPVLIVYLAVGTLWVDLRFGWAAALGLFLGVVAPAVRARSPRAALTAFGEHVEQVLQLAVNTISFARVGAFALAHAGLSAAVVGLMDATAGPLGAFGVAAIGNLFAIVIEGLVVSIQTTRLVLFEFFVRFLRGEGRPFLPLSPPRAGFSPHEKGA